MALGINKGARDSAPKAAAAKTPWCAKCNQEVDIVVDTPSKTLVECHATNATIMSEDRTEAPKKDGRLVFFQ